MGAHQAKGTVRLHGDQELITLTEAEPLADLSRKNQASPVSKLDAKGLGMGHASIVPHVQ